ncbi:DUF1433 domain-containing protein [Tigheibacillus jepli]|uniref:DUF1433 domain-containing protein n=1 Tax=Tigheibacillus jepli TaxID=3035914 RepID=UPI00387E11CE
MSKAEKIIENYIKNNYEDVEEVVFIEHEKSPMGGEVFRGKVNGKAEFSATFNMSDLTIGTIGQKKGFPPIKEECRDKICE